MNLKALDREKVSTLPYKQSIKTTLNSRLNTYTICGWDCYNSYWNNETCRKIRHILENSAGQHIDDIHSKVSKMNHIYPYSTEDVIEMYVKGDERHKYFNIDRIRYGKLYINKNGVITKSPSKPWKTHKSQAYRKKQLAELEYKKQRDKVVADTLLKILNKKPLFDFYVKLLKDEKQCNKNILDYIRWKWKQTIKEEEIKLKKIQSDISKIENGEYNVFYESNVYLYSLQKECHHFEQIIKENK